MKTIDEDIKSGQFKKIYLLYGDEAYLKKQYKDKLKKALVQPDDTMNFTAYEGKDTNPKEVIDLSETLPFFAERRVILIENSGSSAGDVTFKAGNGIQGVADLVVNVANGKTKAVVLESGAFKKAGKVIVTGAATMKAAALLLP